MLRLRAHLTPLLLVSGFLFLPRAEALQPGTAPPQVRGTGAYAQPLQVSDYSGKVLVVTFWASWCAPCINEMRAMEALQRRSDGRLAVVSINIESRSRFDRVRRAQVRDLAVTLTHDGDGAARAAWGVGPIPHLFMIDHEGRLAFEHRGYDDRFIPTLVEHVNQLLQRQNIAATAAK